MSQARGNRKIECLACGWHCRTSAAMILRGLPTCACGSDMHVPALVDQYALDPDAVLHEMLSAEEYRERCKALGFTPRATTRKRGGHLRGDQHKCHGCKAYIPATNHLCECGFKNDIRGNRNLGHYEMPF